MHVVILARDSQLGAVVKDYFDRRLIRPTEILLAPRPEAGEWLVDGSRPSALLLVSRRPDAGTMEICRRVASDAAGAAVPLVVALEEADEASRVALLDAGADAIVQPIELAVLEWRLRAACDPTNVYRDYHGHDLVLKAGATTLLAAGRPVSLTRIEAAIIRVLVHKRNCVVSRGYLEHWLGYSTASRTLDVHVFRLRKKLAGLAVRIETVRSIGYRFTELRAEPVETPSALECPGTDSR